MDRSVTAKVYVIDTAATDSLHDPSLVYSEQIHPLPLEGTDSLTRVLWVDPAKAHCACTTILLTVNEFPIARCNSAVAMFNSVCARNSLPRAVVNAV
jgi:hypothetical protein